MLREKENLVPPSSEALNCAFSHLDVCSGGRRCMDDGKYSAAEGKRRRKGIYGWAHALKILGTR